jgi:uncharacterized protein (TIGR03437 family)
MAPGDLATIYDIAKLNLNGTGQRIAVVGQSAVNLSDIEGFRSQYNLPALNLEAIPYASSIGTTSFLPEADIDLEWAGAVAPSAALIYIYGTDANTAASYAIDNNLAPVVNESFLYCEEEVPSRTASSYESEAQKANSQGITWLAASGDSGAAGCDQPFQSPQATNGLAVSFPASIPEVTAVGGTEFNEGSGTYWNTTNGANGGSARSYIPEKAWNDTLVGAGLAATGGGASSAYSKPAWQTGAGVPSDGARDVPDISLDAANDHDPFYILTEGNWELYGGTSFSTPVFAGIVALLSQYLVASKVQSNPGVGNINPTLYRLAQSAPNAFHDITVGNNIVPCEQATPNCPTTGQFGYSAGPGYDLATGLGSVDAFNLVTQWNGASIKTSIGGLQNAASFQNVYAPGMALSVYGLNLANSTQTAYALPLPTTMAGVSATVNGIAAPLYYISQGQLNIQIPYETAPGAAVLAVTNNGQLATYSFPVSAAAPGIYLATPGGSIVPNASGIRGQTYTLFITGAGEVSPAVSTGAAPTGNQVPVPVLPVSMTIGGVALSPQEMSYIGIPSWSVGTLQINFTVPQNAPLGVDPVVVTVGSAASAAASFTVLQ